MKRIVLGLALGSFVSGAAFGADKPMDMTCGQMMEAKSALPTKMSEVMMSVHDMLTAHAAIMTQNKDPASKKEATALKAIAKHHMTLANEMKKTATTMKAMATVPGAPHDMAKMHSDPKLMEAMHKMLSTHKEIVEMMQKEIAEMESQMKKPGA